MRVHTSKLRPLFLPAVLSSLPCASLVSTVTVDLSASRAIVGMSFRESCSCALTDTHKSATTVRKVASVRHEASDGPFSGRCATRACGHSHLTCPADGEVFQNTAHSCQSYPKHLRQRTSV